MPKIKMLETTPGADSHEDGRTLGVSLYEAGETYEVGTELARAFCEELKVAELANEKKNLGAAPENKAGLTVGTDKLPRVKKA